LLSPKHSRGVTLVELLVAISILAIVSTAVATLLNGAGHTHQYVNKETDAMAQIENAYRRIMHNLRTAKTLTAPTVTTATNTFTITTQVDPSYGNASATVTYSLNASGDLVEDDPRYNPAVSTPNVILRNVRLFTVKRETAVGTSPTQVTIMIQTNTDPVITRTVKINCRNF